MGHTRYSGVLRVRKMECRTCGTEDEDKVAVMSDFGRKDCSQTWDSGVQKVFEDMTADDDLMMEQILENINTTPIGQVLKKIASLPEVRQDKVLSVRRQITEGRYDVGERLDAALERVLEDLTA